MTTTGVRSRPTADPAALRAVMRLLAEPVVVITGSDTHGEPLGLTVSSFSSVSLSPPLVLFCAADTSATWARIALTGRFAVNVLGADQARLAARFASGADRFAGLPYDLAPPGVPVLPEALATLLCAVADIHPAGDHHVVIGAVVSARRRRAGPPLAYHQGAYASVATIPPERCTSDVPHPAHR